MADVRADDCHGDEELFSASSGGDLHINATSLTGQANTLWTPDNGTWLTHTCTIVHVDCRILGNTAS